MVASPVALLSKAKSQNKLMKTRCMDLYMINPESVCNSNHRTLKKPYRTKNRKSRTHMPVKGIAMESRYHSLPEFQLAFGLHSLVQLLTKGKVERGELKVY